MDFTKILDQAKALVSDTAKLESLLDKAEVEAKNIPKVGNQVAKVAALAELLVFYFNQEYTVLPKRSAAAAAFALVYFVSPIDIIPDFIPVIGKVDDAMVAALCWNMVDADLKDFKEWKKSRPAIAE